MLIAQMVMVIKKHLAKLVAAAAAAAAIGQAWPAHEHCFGLAIGKKTSNNNNKPSQAPLPGLSFP